MWQARLDVKSTGIQRNMPSVDWQIIQPHQQRPLEGEEGDPPAEEYEEDPEPSLDQDQSGEGDAEGTDDTALQESSDATASSEIRQRGSSRARLEAEDVSFKLRWKSAGGVM